LIDLHFHCLPGIDDGPASWDDAVALCRAAAAEGTTTIVATPHVLRDPWINDRVAERDGLIAKLNDLLGGTPAVLPGCEYFFTPEAVDLVEKGKDGPLIGLNRSRYLLIELDSAPVTRATEAAFHELTILGITPIIAHPERSTFLTKNPAALGRLVEIGARIQLTAAAIAGDFGSRSVSQCEQFFDLGLVHLVASDAHSVSSRPPRLAPAREKVRRAWGADAEQGIFDGNPRAVIEGTPLPWLGV
jgi:protein-tyrosine phosphatase